MSKSMYDMDDVELTQLIDKLSHNVERLAYERPNSAEYRHEAGVLSDARQLLAEAREICQNPDCKHKRSDHKPHCTSTKEKEGSFASDRSRACSCTKFERT